MTSDDRWSLWAHRLCTVLLWCFLPGFLFSFGLLLWGLLGDDAGVRSFFSGNGRLKLDNVAFDLGAVQDTAGLRWFLAVFFFFLIAAAAGVYLVLTRLRRILDDVAYQKPFSPTNATDLKVIGTVLIVGAVALPACKDGLQLLAGAIIAGHNAELDLLPDLTLLLCGFLVRTLAVVFARGARLQADADLTV